MDKLTYTGMLEIMEQALMRTRELYKYMPEEDELAPNISIEEIDQAKASVEFPLFYGIILLVLQGGTPLNKAVYSYIDLYANITGVREYIGEDMWNEYNEKLQANWNHIESEV